MSDNDSQVDMSTNRLTVRQAADRLEQLAAAGTPAPWRDSSTLDGVKYQALVADSRHPDRPAGKGWDWEDAYGGCLVGESILSADRALLADMRNAAEHLPALLRALADEDPIAAGRHARALALALTP